MSGSEKTLQEFLQRWSRRKIAGADGAREATDAQSDEGQGSKSAPPTGAPRCTPDISAAFDPASLPPIESITAASDVRAFLAAGVPVELTRAALRRAWVSDPTIRDFIGIAENQWDFTKPAGVPGFGPLEFTAELHRMVTELLRAAPSSDAAKAGASSGNTAMPDPAATSSPETAAASPVMAERQAVAVTRSGDKIAATQSDEPIEPASPRKHGAALPK
jgi:Protein of unknown function (DUF3306)